MSNKKQLNLNRIGESDMEESPTITKRFKFKRSAIIPETTPQGTTSLKPLISGKSNILKINRLFFNKVGSKSKFYLPLGPPSST